MPEITVHRLASTDTKQHGYLQGSRTLVCCPEDILHIHLSFTFDLVTSFCLMQLPEGSAFFFIHGCFIMSSRQSLLLESLTSSCIHNHTYKSVVQPTPINLANLLYNHYF